MQAFSAESRVALGNYGSIIDREARRSSCSKQNNTRKARKLHFLKFCKSVGIEDPCLPRAEHEARNYLVAYTVHLILGHTIKSIRVKHATLMKYVNAAQKFFTDRRLPDPTAGVTDDLVTPLLNAVKSYEKQPNRKEMIYDNMLAHMLKICRLSPPHSLDSALLDWIILGRFTGARLSEWAQEQSKTIKMTIPNLAHELPEPKAFIFDDFEFFDSSSLRVSTTSHPTPHL